MSQLIVDILWGVAAFGAGVVLSPIILKALGFNRVQK